MLDNPLLSNALQSISPNNERQQAEQVTEYGMEIVDVFPDFINSFIKDQVQAYESSYEFYLAGVLSATSAAIGNSLFLKMDHSWHVPASTFICVVGNSGMGKSPALKNCIQPIVEMESILKKKYDGQYAEYKNLDKEEKKFEDPPIRKEIFLNDTTIEAVMRVLNHNPHGILVFRDELLGWIKSMNAYKNGADVETWLSIWSNGIAKITRQNGNEYTIPKAFASVLGGIQPAKLLELVKGGGLDNGFFYRFLFAYPNDQRMKVPTFKGSSEKVAIKYKEAIKSLFVRAKNLEGCSHAFILSDRARRHYDDFSWEIARKVNESEDNNYQSMMVKMRAYALRLSLILHTLDVFELPEFQFENSHKFPLGRNTMEKAIKLTDWFIIQSERAFTKALNLAPLDDLNEQSKKFYDALDDQFTTSDAKALARSYNISERSLFRMLKDKTLFEKIKHGKYGKCC
jgi:hypothetical protein